MMLKLEEDVFDRLRPNSGKSHKAEITSLGLRTQPPSGEAVAAPVGQPGAKQDTTAQPKPTGANPTAATPNPAPAQQCLQFGLNPEGMLSVCKGFRRRFEEWQKSGHKPAAIFYLVFPQQGHPLSTSTKDGKRTFLFLFATPQMARAFAAAKDLKAVIAACRLESLPGEADRWIAAGINSYALNPCPRCGNMTLYAITELQSEPQFVETWALDAVNRKVFGELVVRGCQNQIGANPTGVRSSLERMRDHLDCCNPYLHWVIALLAGMAGDMQANAAGIERLEELAPQLAAKVKGKTFEPGDQSQMLTMGEAMLGLLASYGIVNVPMKPREG